MNMNQIVNMFMRIIMRKAINSGINKGIDAASGMGRKRRPAPSTPNLAQDQVRTGQLADDGQNEQGQKKLTPEQKQAQKAARQARRAARVARQNSKP